MFVEVNAAVSCVLSRRRYADVHGHLQTLTRKPVAWQGLIIRSVMFWNIYRGCGPCNLKTK